MIVDIGILTNELQAAGLPVVGVASTGRIDYSRALTPTEQTQEAAVIAAHDPDLRSKALATIITTAQTTVGVKLVNLTAAQVKALLACILFQAGGVDLKTMTVKPLTEWVK